VYVLVTLARTKRLVGRTLRPDFRSSDPAVPAQTS